MRQKKLIFWRDRHWKRVLCFWGNFNVFTTYTYMKSNIEVKFVRKTELLITDFSPFFCSRVIEFFLFLFFWIPLFCAPHPTPPYIHYLGYKWTSVFSFNF